MGTTKSEMFTKHQNEIATIIKALGHPARIAILEYLMKIDSCICSDIVEELPLAQPTISQHLKELKKANLIKIAQNNCSELLRLDKIKEILQQAVLVEQRPACPC